jgi:catalase-peroxidase
VEQAAKNTGVQVPFAAGRTDASQEQTDVASFAVLEPVADDFRNYLREGINVPAEILLVERAEMLTLSVPEMTVHQRFLREPARHGRVATDVRRGFFRWVRSPDGRPQMDRQCVDLIFGSNSELRAVAEVYACDDAKEKFVRDFVAAWSKVMNLDRYDIAQIASRREPFGVSSDSRPFAE